MDNPSAKKSMPVMEREPEASPTEDELVKKEPGKNTPIRKKVRSTTRKKQTKQTSKK
jgi:hypothetical protein